MESLDLTVRPPRRPYERLGGLLLLARTIDKLRATLPGGNAGVYKIKGLSADLLELLGIEEADLRDAVARAKNDDDVVAWIHERTDLSRYDAINAELDSGQISDVSSRPGFTDRYPVAATLSPETSLLELLERDDKYMFDAEKS